MGSKIEWTDETWNPTVGCSYASPGCAACFAAREASTRLAHLPAYAGLAVNGRFTGEIRTLPERLEIPLRWRRPRRVFVNSMSDLFHPDIDAAFVAEVFAVMAVADRHTFQVLTKRPQHMARLCATDGPLVERLADAIDTVVPDWEHPLRYPQLPLANVWLGASIENDRYTFRADHVRATPAAVRFLSLEPLIGPLPSLDVTGIDWVIVGGETGPGARPMDLGWARDIRDRCTDAGVAFFFKQTGSATARQLGLAHRAGGDLDELPEDLRIRDWPAGH